MSAARSRAVSAGAAAPEFELPDTAGVSRASGDYLGAPLVVVLTRHVH